MHSALLNCITFACLLLCSSAFILDQQNDPVVDINCGRALGLYNNTDGGYVFRGIPYASPPINALRWHTPVPLDNKNHNCWKGILDATEFGNMCTQTNITGGDGISGSEDCLFLNVWTPSLNTSAKLPVLVFIHGGSLVSGYGNEEGYAPSIKLAVETNMVYVSLNYRLNAFGFLALEWLVNESESNSSGNYGFLDQIEALKWVQQNIVQFGGDPNLVTIYGQSSGGTSIFALLASPLCQGLFHRAWLSSASPILNKTREDAFRDNQEFFVQKTGCHDVNCLYSLPEEDVIKSIPFDVYPNWDTDDLLRLPEKGVFDGALAIVDGYVLPLSPLEAWTRGEGVDVPLLIGSTAQETDINLPPAGVQTWTWASHDYENHVRTSLSQFSDVIAEMALKLYPVNISTPQFQLSSMVSDVRVSCGTDYISQIASASFKSPVYRYVATYTPPQIVHPYGVDFPVKYAFHGIDSFAFFGTMESLGYNLTARDVRWKNNVQQEVTHFIKTGSPLSATWNTYPEVTAMLSDYTTVSCGYHADACQFWLANGFFSYSWIN